MVKFNCDVAYRKTCKIKMKGSPHISKRSEGCYFDLVDEIDNDRISWRLKEGNELIGENYEM